VGTDANAPPTPPSGDGPTKEAEAPPTVEAAAPSSLATTASPTIDPPSPIVESVAAEPPAEEVAADTSKAAPPVETSVVDASSKEISSPAEPSSAVTPLRGSPSMAATAATASSAPAPATPGGAVELHLVGITDVGLVREHNEDNFTCVRLDDDARDPEQLLHHTLVGRGTLLCVCDGMGGAAAGEVASSMAVATVPEILRSETTGVVPAGVIDDAEAALARQLRHAAEEANRRIFAEQQTNLARSGMGTTMTAAVLRGDRAVIAQVGDSRCYFFRRGKLTQVTRDQSLVNQLLETGQITPEQAKYFEHSNVILQALGVQEDVEVQLSHVALRRGDRLMLCSDGLVGVITDEEIAAVMSSVDDPGDAARLLIELANGAGGPDNITVVVAYLGGEGLAEPAESDVIEYQTWRIDPLPPAPAEPQSVEPPVPPTQQNAAAQPDQAPPSAPANPVELFSMATVLALLVGSIVVGWAIYHRAVPCRVHATRAGLSVTADGRDTGARTVEGEVGVRLRPGRHLVGLAAPRHGIELAQQEVEVRTGEACVVRFDDPAAAADAVESTEAAAGSGRRRWW
jgi:protein phosphatase